MLAEGSFELIKEATMPLNVTVNAGANNTNLLGTNGPMAFYIGDNSPPRRVVLQFVANRSNTVAGGSGLYEFFIDGVALTGVRSKQVFGDVQSMVSMLALRGLNKGDHTFDIKLTAAVGNETCIAGVLLAYSVLDA